MRCIFLVWLCVFCSVAESQDSNKADKTPAEKSSFVTLTKEQSREVEVLNLRLGNLQKEKENAELRFENARLGYLITIITYKAQLKLGDEYEWDAGNNRFVLAGKQTQADPVKK